MAHALARRALVPAASGLLLLASSCSGNDTPQGNPDMPTPFDPSSPSAYTSKVKTLLTGLAPTDDELKAVTADPSALPGLIDGWMAQPQFSGKMQDFFTQAFQQTQLQLTDFEDQLGRTSMQAWAPADRARFVASAMNSFPLTALQLIKEGRPFTEVLTTRRFMLNPPLLSSLAFMEALEFDDVGNPRPAEWVQRRFPKFAYTRQTDTMNTLEQTIDPASPQFMRWYDPKPYMGVNPRCLQYPFTITPGAVARTLANALIHTGDILYGGRPGCGSTTSQFTDADWSDWRMITIRAPKANEERTVFWDLPRLRSKDPNQQELVASTPRVGFLTTLAFLANWPTNGSNLARVTMNQALIVALGKSLADATAVVPITESGAADKDHAKPGTACYNCHKVLDPMRNFYRQSMTVNYHAQVPGSLPAEQQVAAFELEDISLTNKTGGVVELAGIMAGSQRFALAWTQKLCQFANSLSCSEDDPEFLRVADAFRKSNHDFKVLVRTLFSSPLVTQAAVTKTATDVGSTNSVQRREHFCAALQNRLGIADACLLLPVTTSTIQNLAYGLPGSGYSRGSATPLMPRDPDLFFASAVENLCGQMAAKVIDVAKCPGSKCWQGAQPAPAIADFVRLLMALPPSDPRAADMTQILTDHFNDAKGQGQSASDALRSTFVLACSSPLSAASGL